MFVNLKKKETKFQATLNYLKLVLPNYYLERGLFFKRVTNMFLQPLHSKESWTRHLSLEF